MRDNVNIHRLCEASVDCRSRDFKRSLQQLPVCDVKPVPSVRPGTDFVRHWGSDLCLGTSGQLNRGAVPIDASPVDRDQTRRRLHTPGLVIRDKIDTHQVERVTIEIDRRPVDREQVASRPVDCMRSIWIDSMCEDGDRLDVSDVCKQNPLLPVDGVDAVLPLTVPPGVRERLPLTWFHRQDDHLIPGSTDRRRLQEDIDELASRSFPQNGSFEHETRLSFDQNIQCNLSLPPRLHRLRGVFVDVSSRSKDDVAAEFRLDDDGCELLCEPCRVNKSFSEQRRLEIGNSPTHSTGKPCDAAVDAKENSVRSSRGHDVTDVDTIGNASRRAAGRRGAIHNHDAAAGKTAIAATAADMEWDVDVAAVERDVISLQVAAASEPARGQRAGDGCTQSVAGMAYIQEHLEKLLRKVERKTRKQHRQLFLAKLVIICASVFLLTWIPYIVRMLICAYGNVNNFTIVIRCNNHNL